MSRKQFIASKEAYEAPQALEIIFSQDSIICQMSPLLIISALESMQAEDYTSTSIWTEGSAIE